MTERKELIARDEVLSRDLNERLEEIVTTLAGKRPDAFEIFCERGSGGCVAKITLPLRRPKLDDGGPTTVALSSFSASQSKRGVVLRWQTASEADTVGVNLYRRQQGKLVKLNWTLIPSAFGGTASGHPYSWLDRSSPRGAARYRLQAVSMSGERSWVGSATIAR